MLSMPNTRKVIRKQEAVAEQLARALKAKGVRKNQRKPLIDRAASGRPVDLAQQARAALADRRVQRNVDIIAGRASL